MRTEYVPASRLAHGTWNHKTQEEEGEGDIRSTYSADTIAESSKIRGTFRFAGSQWVCVCNSNNAARAYRVVSPELFDGTPTTYREKVHGPKEDWYSGGESARNDPNGFYHGMTVKCAKRTFVLCGPEVTFEAGEETEAPEQTKTPEPKSTAVAVQATLFAIALCVLSALTASAQNAQIPRKELSRKIVLPKIDTGWWTRAHAVSSVLDWQTTALWVRQCRTCTEQNPSNRFFIGARPTNARMVVFGSLEIVATAAIPNKKVRRVVQGVLIASHVSAGVWNLKNWH